MVWNFGAVVWWMQMKTLKNLTISTVEQALTCCKKTSTRKSTAFDLMVSEEICMYDTCDRFPSGHVKLQNDPTPTQNFCKSLFKFWHKSSLQASTHHSFNSAVSWHDTHLAETLLKCKTLWTIWCDDPWDSYLKRGLFHSLPCHRTAH